jgi:hypothetical protein
LTGLSDGPVKKAMLKTPLRQRATLVILAMPEGPFSLTSSILIRFPTLLAARKLFCVW